MSKIVLLISLPGGGKTYLANKDYVPQDYILIDDPVQCDSHKVKNLDQSKNYVITDPWLCHPTIRSMAEDILTKQNFEIECIYFENNIEKCINNIKYRNDGRNINNFNIFGYKIPDGAAVRTIWSPDADTDIGFYNIQDNHYGDDNNLYGHPDD